MIRGSYHKKVTPEMKEAFKKLREEGVSFRKIASEYNLAPSTIRYHLDNGFKQRIKNHVGRYAKEGRLWWHKNPDKRRTYMKEYMREYNKKILVCGEQRK